MFCGWRDRFSTTASCSINLIIFVNGVFHFKRKTWQRMVFLQSPSRFDSFLIEEKTEAPNQKASGERLKKKNLNFPPKSLIIAEKLIHILSQTD